ncbi:MAG: CBS and ACT domain-containing protein [Syntrophomonadaceae bacterium]|jgi:acetoin utilization protein AcuB|nr:CBS and ACT domain-containing protein [Syntrophomonadaceae bacterium]MDH7498222.1 CBS and ACT domain-containing protein [Syntrophomonadaceae bacterium]
MRVRDYMSTDVKTIGLDASVLDAFALMNENNIRRLPVMDGDKLVGIVTLSDLENVPANQPTTLSFFGTSYLLEKTLLRDVLPKHQELITIHPDDYVETAASLMKKHKISTLPVVLDGRLVGIITESDIFDALIRIMGVDSRGTRIDLKLVDRPGELAKVATIISDLGGNIANIVRVDLPGRDDVHLILRITCTDSQRMVSALREKGFEIESVIVKP